LPATAVVSSESEGEEFEDEETDSGDEDETGGAQDGAGGDKEAAAGEKRKRKGAVKRPTKRIPSTTGTFWGHHFDGFPAPPIEMVRCESPTMAMDYIHRIFANVPKLPKYIGFDAMVGKRSTVEHAAQLFCDNFTSHVLDF